MANLTSILGNQDMQEAASKIGGGRLPLVPNGIYEFMAVESEIENKDGKTSIKQKFVIRNGEHAGKEFTSWFEISNQGGADAWKVEKGRAAYALFCNAVGFKTFPKDTNDALRKPLLATTETKKGKDYTNNEGQTVAGSDFSTIVMSSFKPLPAVGNATPAAATADAPAGGMPWMQQ